MWIELWIGRSMFLELEVVPESEVRLQQYYPF